MTSARKLRPSTVPGHRDDGTLLQLQRSAQDRRTHAHAPPVSDYDAEPWHDLFVATAGAGAALPAFLSVSLRPVLASTQGHPSWSAVRLLTLLPGSVTYVVGGISLLIGRGGRLAWLVAGIIGAFVGAMVNAWVLLVEILR